MGKRTAPPQASHRIKGNSVIKASHRVAGNRKIEASHVG